MYLQENLHFRQLLVEVQPDLVDQDTHGRLRHPRAGFGEELLEPVEDIPTIPPTILDETIPADLLLRPAVPLQDAGVLLEPELLRSVYLVYGPACVGRDRLGGAYVVRCVAEDLGELPLVLSRAAMTWIRGVGLNQFFQRGWLLVIKRINVKQVHISAKAKSSLEHNVVSFPNHDLEVGAVEVHVEEGVAGVWDVHGADVRQAEIHTSSSCRLARTFGLLTWDRLKVAAGAKGILGRRETVRVGR